LDKESNFQGEKGMSISEKKLKLNLDNIKRIAVANTIKNKKGLTVITKDDPFREEKNWDSTVRNAE
jgi:hypothetical protein